MATSDPFTGNTFTGNTRQEQLMNSLRQRVRGSDANSNSQQRTDSYIDPRRDEEDFYDNNPEVEWGSMKTATERRDYTREKAANLSGYDPSQFLGLQTLAD